MIAKIGIFAVIGLHYLYMTFISSASTAKFSENSVVPVDMLR